MRQIKTKQCFFWFGLVLTGLITATGLQCVLSYYPESRKSIH